MPDESRPIEPSFLGSIPPLPSEELRAMRERLEGNKFYSAVGRIATEWAIFEHTIQIQLWKLARVDYDVGACLTSQIGNSGRLMNCLIAMLELRGADEEHLKSIRSFCRKSWEPSKT
jgi:hypothetical protein